MFAKSMTIAGYDAELDEWLVAVIHSITQELDEAVRERKVARAGLAVKADHPLLDVDLVAPEREQLADAGARGRQELNYEG